MCVAVCVFFGFTLVHEALAKGLCAGAYALYAIGPASGFLRGRLCGCAAPAIAHAFAIAIGVFFMCVFGEHVYEADAVGIVNEAAIYHAGVDGSL